MKFDKVLKSTCMTFENHRFRSATLPYKYWKKYIKNHKEHMDSHIIYKTLEKQCQQVDRIFHQELQQTLYKRSWCSCLKSHKVQEEHPTDLITFSEINQMALYKICKKLQKNGATDLMAYYQTWKTQRRFHFLGTYQLTYLQFQHHLKETECPICMEDSNTMVIFDCQHYVCLECLSQMTQIQRKKGTLFNRLASASFSCPMCRTYKPIHCHWDKYHFYPKVPKNERI